MITEITEMYDALGIDRSAIQNAVDILRTARELHGTVYTIGNGGSMSTAEHFANDLGSIDFRAVCLGCNISTLTAIANDYGFENIFNHQLVTIKRSNDVLIAISTSGNSQNIVKAVYNFTGPVIAMVGLPGGSLIDMCKQPLIALTNFVDLAENIHLAMVHFIIRELTNGPFHTNS